MMLLQLLARLFRLLASPWPLVGGVVIMLLAQSGWVGTALLVGIPTVLFIVTNHVQRLITDAMLRAVLGGQSVGAGITTEPIPAEASAEYCANCQHQLAHHYSAPRTGCMLCTCSWQWDAELGTRNPDA